MLLKDLVEKLSTHYPKTLETLTVGQLTTFATLSADVLERTNNGYGYDFAARRAPVEFLSQCLGPAEPHSTWARLWILTYAHLPSCKYNTNLIKDHGIPSNKRPKNAIVIPENSFRPPNTHCLTCKSKKRRTPIALQIRRPVKGYLFDIGGIESMQYFYGYCRSAFCFFTFISQTKNSKHPS